MITVMPNQTFKLALALLALAAASPVAQGQTTPAKAAAPAAPAAQPSLTEQWIKDVKNPTPWFSWGADLRLRNEYFNNALSLSETLAGHEQDYFRFRGRIWTTVSPVKELSLNARMAGEPREWMKPSYASQYGSRTGFEERYAIVDNLNAKWTNAFNQPLTIVAGRQDIMLGDPLNWWLVADGTPGDGSWTFFLDSARLTYDAAEIKTKFDVMYIYQSASPDAWMPTMGRSSESHPSPYKLTEQNEQGAILYVSNKSINNAQIDGYFIYKRDSRAYFYNGASGDNADIYTIGAKVTGNPAEHWQYSAEGAYQFGNKEDTVSGVFANRDISAFGVNAKLSYLFKDKLNNQAHLIYEYLSGDDSKSTGKDEMFDVLWGRWPRWSELYIYSYVKETSGKIAQLNNIQRVGFGWSLNPIKNMSLAATYNALFAPESTPTRTISSSVFGGGHFRGHYLQTVLKHKFTDHLSAHLWSEFVWMGDYYARRDMMTFLRAEVMLTW
jgi:hypothetical protein